MYLPALTIAAIVICLGLPSSPVLIMKFGLKFARYSLSTSICICVLVSVIARSRTVLSIARTFGNCSMSPRYDSMSASKS